MSHHSLPYNLTMSDPGFLKHLISNVITIKLVTLHAWTKSVRLKMQSYALTTCVNANFTIKNVCVLK